MLLLHLLNLGESGILLGLQIRVNGLFLDFSLQPGPLNIQKHLLAALLFIQDAVL